MFLYTLMLAIWLELHSERVEPVFPSFIQLIPKRRGITEESYSELIIRILFSMELQAFSRKKHLYYSPTKKRLQTAKGVF